MELPFPFPYQKEKADKVTFPIKGARGLLQKQPLTLCQESICRYRQSHVKIYEDARHLCIKAQMSCVLLCHFRTFYKNAIRAKTR